MNRREAAALNGKLAGRPKRALQRVWETEKGRCLTLGRSSHIESIKFLIHVRDSADFSISDRLRAAENLMDRFGLPRGQEVTGLEDAAPKLFEWVGYKAPASHDGNRNGRTHEVSRN